MGAVILGLSKLQLVQTLYSFTDCFSLKHFRLCYLGKPKDYTTYLNIYLKDTDSIYFALCCDALDDILGQNPTDINHYTQNELSVKREKWEFIKKKFFVTRDWDEVSYVINSFNFIFVREHQVC